MEQQQRLGDALGHEQRAVADVDVLAVPGKAAGRRHAAVAVAPVAHSPVGREGADAGVGDHAGEKVGLGGQVLGQETSVGGADGPDPAVVDIGMGAQQLLDAADDLLGGDLAPVVDVGAGELLAVADGAARLQDADDVAVGGVPVLGVAAAEAAPDRGGAAVEIDDAGPEAGGVEIGREAQVAADGAPLPGLEAPVLAPAETHAGEPFAVVVLQHPRSAAQVEHVQLLRRAQPRARIGDTVGARPADALDGLAAGLQPDEFPLRRRAAVKAGVILIGHLQQHAAAGVPESRFDGRGELAADGLGLPGLQVIDIGLGIEIVGHRLRRQGAAQAVECRRAAEQQQLPGIRRPGEVLDPGIIQQFFPSAIGQMEKHDGVAVKRADLGILAVGGQQQRALVGADAHLGEVVGEIGQRLPCAGSRHEQGQRLARFRRAVAVVQGANMPVSLVRLRLLANGEHREGAVIGPPAGREIFDPRQQRPAAMVLQVITADVGEVLFLAGESEAARIAQPLEVVHATQPARGEQAGAVARIQHFQPAVAAAGARRQLAQHDGDAAAVGRERHAADVHRVQHVLHAGDPGGIERNGQRGVLERRFALQPGLQRQRLAAMGGKDALDQQQVLAVGQVQLHAALAGGGGPGQLFAAEADADGKRGVDLDIRLQPATAFQVGSQVDGLLPRGAGEARGGAAPGQLLLRAPLERFPGPRLKARRLKEIEIQGRVGAVGERRSVRQNFGRPQDQP